MHQTSGLRRRALAHTTAALLFAGALPVALPGCASPQRAGSALAVRSTPPPEVAPAEGSATAPGSAASPGSEGSAGSTQSPAGSASSPGEAVVAAGSTERPGSTEAPAAPRGRMFRGMSEDELLEAMATRPVVRVIERFSSTTLVYHLDLGDGLEIAFKPDRVGQEDWWRHEVAGYRLARVLGVEERVPPVVTRRIPLTALGRWGRDADLVLSGRRRDSVVGAAIFWMPVLRNGMLHTPENTRRWTGWLDPHRVIPEADRPLAGDVATLLAFDFLQANTDRWNSGNVRLDEHGRVVFRDNNGGWFVTGLERPGYVDAVRRLPRYLAEGIARATPQALSEELARDPGHEGPMLTARHLAAYEVRRQLLLQRIRHLVARYGEEAVHPWP